MNAVLRDNKLAAIVLIANKEVYILYIIYLKCSSNLIVAALWNTTFTLSQRNFRSSGFIPSSGNVISPKIGTNFS